MRSISHVIKNPCLFINPTIFWICLAVAGFTVVGCVPPPAPVMNPTSLRALDPGEVAVGLGVHGEPLPTRLGNLGEPGQPSWSSNTARIGGPVSGDLGIGLKSGRDLRLSVSWSPYGVSPSAQISHESLSREGRQSIGGLGLAIRPLVLDVCDDDGGGCKKALAQLAFIPHVSAAERLGKGPLKLIGQLRVSLSLVPYGGSLTPNVALYFQPMIGVEYQLGERVFVAAGAEPMLALWVSGVLPMYPAFSLSVESSF